MILFPKPYLWLPRSPAPLLMAPPWDEEAARALEYTDNISCGMPVLSLTNAWNPLDADAGITLSNVNLTFSGDSAAYHNVRATFSASTGKKYWEVHSDLRNSAANQNTQGIGLASATLTNYIGSDASGLGWAGDGNVYNNGISNGIIQTWAQGDTLCFALDITNGKVWFRTNGGNWNNDVIANQNPATNTGGFAASGLLFAMGSVGRSGTGNDTLTANFGASPYAQTPPVGFGNW